MTQELNEKTTKNTPPAIKGKIQKTFCSKPGFSAGILIEASTGRQIRFSGKLYLKEGDLVIVKGNVVHDKKYGEGFFIESFIYDQDLNSVGLVDYLVSCKIKGLGKARAEKLVKTLGKDFEETLLKDPATISSIGDITLDSAFELQKDWTNKRDYATLYTQLAGYGISAGQCNKLIVTLGSSVINILKENPYSLIGKIEGFGFKRIDQIARNTGIPKNAPERIKACIVYMLEENEGQGHCWYDRKKLIDDANRELIIDTLDSKELIAAEIDKLKGNARVTVSKRVYDNDTLALTGTYLAEKGIWEEFKSITSNPIFADIPKDEINKVLNEAPYNFSNEDQWKALELFISYNKLLITGVAGGGKSWCVGNIAKLCSHFNIPFVLCAPTGIAAKRLEQACGFPAFTIHRMLGFTGTEYNKEVLPEFRNARVVIIDELSMVPVTLMWELLRRLESRSLVLAGDHQQLPCIGTGNILKDILDHNILPYKTLTKCVRQAGELKDNCNKILEGKVAPTSENFIGETERKPWYKITNFTTDIEIYNYLEEIYKNSLVDKLKVDILRDVQLLTPTHKGTLGTVCLNKTIQRIVQKKLYGVTIDPNKDRFYVGDKVMQHRNNYDLGVMNGTQGIITKYNSFDDLVVKYDDREIIYTGEHVKDLKLSFCNTVHKCVYGDTFIWTKEGLQQIKELFTTNKNIGSYKAHNLHIFTDKGWKEVSKLHVIGKEKAYKITTRMGFELVVGKNHRIKVANTSYVNDTLSWLNIKDLKVGDYIPLKRNTNVDIIDEVKCPNLDIFISTKTKNSVNIPETINEELAELLGAYVADANCTDKDDGRIEVAKDQDHLEYLGILTNKLFNVNITYRDRSFYFHSQPIRKFLLWCGLDYVKSIYKRIPHVILKSPTNIRAAFIKGLFSGDGSVADHLVYSTSSKILATQLQTLFLDLGIVSKLVKVDQTELTNRDSWRIEIYGGIDKIIFRHKIGLCHKEKVNKLNIMLDKLLASNKFGKTNCDIIPCGKSIIYNLREELRRIYGRNFDGAKIFGTLFNSIIKDRSRLNYEHLRKILEYYQDSSIDISHLEKIYEENRYFDEIMNIEEVEEELFDLTVPDGNEYLSNGFISHNCQGQEYPFVIVICHKSHIWQLNRNILYTGLTRARQTAVILGDLWSMTTASKKIDANVRNTFLSLWGRDANITK